MGYVYSPKKAVVVSADANKKTDMGLYQIPMYRRPQ